MFSGSAVLLDGYRRPEAANRPRSSPVLPVVKIQADVANRLGASYRSRALVALVATQAGAAACGLPVDAVLDA